MPAASIAYLQEKGECGSICLLSLNLGSPCPVIDAVRKYALDPGTLWKFCMFTLITVVASQVSLSLDYLLK